MTIEMMMERIPTLEMRRPTEGEALILLYLNAEMVRDSEFSKDMTVRSLAREMEMKAHSNLQDRIQSLRREGYIAHDSLDLLAMPLSLRDVAVNIFNP